MKMVAKAWIVALGLALLLPGCVERPEPQPASYTTEPPPWPAPRDAISWIEDTGLPHLSLGDETDPWIVELNVEVDGQDVEVPAYIGVDRLRAVQAPVHTHESGGTVWLEGQGNREITLGQFFALWGVEFTDECLAQYCSELIVKVDGAEVEQPTSVLLRGVSTIDVVAYS